MPKSKIIIALGLIIALMPVLGFPHAWEAVFQVIAGLSIVGLSVWSSIDKKLTLRAKAQKRQARRVAESTPSGSETETETGAEPEGQSHPARRVTDFYPKTGQKGRRITDIDWNTPDEPLS